MNRLPVACLALVMPLSLMWACGSTTSGGFASGGSGGSGAVGGTLSLVDPSGGAGNSVAVGGDPSGGSLVGTGGSLVGTGGSLATELCGGDGCVCSNGLDDDQDGLVDGFDPECTGPADNDEGSFATGIPGDNRDPKWQDCFFDGNSGAGDDGCRYATACLTGELAQDHKSCSLTEACIEYCAPLTPNGCDCFGCCTVGLGDGETIDIQTGSSCSLASARDAEACPVCVKSDQCSNGCGRCELCPGKTLADLPPDCSPDEGAGGEPGDPGDPGYTCEGGLQVCGPSLPSCGVGKYCSQGCCLKSPPK